MDRKKISKLEFRECEVYSNIRVPCASHIVIRLDGRGFHPLTEKLGFERPYDDVFADVMTRTAVDIMEEFSPTLIYTFSDELNILMGSIPFSGRVEKLDSVFSGFTSSAFLLNLLEHFKHEDIPKPVSFDSRVIPLSEDALTGYFRSRQDEAWRNCLNGYAYWTLREEIGGKEAAETLKGMKSASIHEMLFERGINVAKAPAWQRRGIAVYKRLVTVPGYDPVLEKHVKTMRKRICIDRELPIFTEDFFRSLSNL